jgi:hemerythrin
METPFLAWREEFVIGHESLDAEHRRLAEMINETNMAERAGKTSQQMNAIVDRLRCLAVDHFQHENSILNKISSGPLPSGGNRQTNLRAMVDASISEHIISHRRSLTKLGSIILDIHSALNPVEQSFSKDLKAWFIDHMKDFDARLKAVFKTMPNRVF